MKKHMLESLELAWVDYDSIWGSASDDERADMKAFLAAVLPQEWIHAYRNTRQQHNIHEIPIEDVNYRWDLSHELATKEDHPERKCR